MVADNMTAWLATPQAAKSGHAAFISPCYFHCGSNPTFGVVKDQSSGLTGAQAFGQWMTDPVGCSKHLWNAQAAWNVTSESICGADNTPGWEQRSVGEESRTAVPDTWRVAV